MEKKCITCHRIKKFKNKISKDFKCRICRNKEYKAVPESNKIKRINKVNPINVYLLNDIIKFVSVINRQKGYATYKQIFVEMISLYNDLPKNYDESISLDGMATNKQLSYMWNRLKMVSSGGV